MKSGSRVVLVPGYKHEKVVIPPEVIEEHNCGSCLCDSDSPLLHCLEEMARDVDQARYAALKFE